MLLNTSHSFEDDFTKIELRFNAGFRCCGTACYHREFDSEIYRRSKEFHQEKQEATVSSYHVLYKSPHVSLYVTKVQR